MKRLAETTLGKPDNSGFDLRGFYGPQSAGAVDRGFFEHSGTLTSEPLALEFPSWW